MLPLSLDGSLRKKATSLSEEGDPGHYSPRPPPTILSASHCENSAKLENPNSGVAIPANTCSSLSVLGCAISDPELESTGSRTRARKKSISPDRSQVDSVAGVPTQVSQRRPVAIDTLLNHQQARDRSPSHAGVAAADEAKFLQWCDVPQMARSIDLIDAYVGGSCIADFVRYAQDARQRLSVATRLNAGFRQHPAHYVTALAAQGEYVAVGDRSGQVSMMKRRTMTVDRIASVDAYSSTGCSDESMCARPCSGEPYQFFTSQQVYVPVIDPLNSCSVSPSVTALSFLPCTPTPASYLLCSNEKTIRLSKAMQVRDAPAQFRAVDKIDSKSIGPLTSSARTSSVAFKPVSRYAQRHEYNVHSLCALSDSAQFLSADDLTIHLWCTEYPDTSLECYSMRPPEDEEAREAIRGVRHFPHEPFLLFVSTSSGQLRVIDMRQSLRWLDQSPMEFCNPCRDEADGTYSQVTNSLSDCALSPCGRYIAGRDFMSTCLWDIRRSSSPSPSYDGDRRPDDIVQRWELHPHLRSDLELLYQTEVLFERFELQFLCPSIICTGGFSSLYIHDIHNSPVNDTCHDNPVLTVPLPTLDGAMKVERGSLAVAGSGQATSAGLVESQLGSRTSFLSRPMMSAGGYGGLLCSCGQVVMQLGYRAA